MDNKSKPSSAAAESTVSQPGQVSRRGLLKTGAGALPAVLTLQSGAAFARSSNVITASSFEVMDEMGRTMCIQLDSVIPVDDYSQIYDMGDPPQAVINVLRGEAEGRLYYVQKDDKDIGKDVHPGLACQMGGQFYVKPAKGPWEVVNVPTGIVGSAAAVYSMTAGDGISHNVL